MSVIWYKTWSDLFDNKIRTLLAVLSITAGVFAIGVTFGMTDQLLSGLDASHRASAPAHISIYLTDYIDDVMVNRLKNIDGVKDIELSNHLSPIQYKTHPDQAWQNGEIIIREDYETQTYDQLNLQSGEWPDRHQIGIERLSGEFYNIAINDTVIFKVGERTRERQINGSIQDKLSLPPLFGGSAVFFMHNKDGEIFYVPKGEYNQLLVQVTPYSPALAKQVASTIKDRLSQEKAQVAFSIFKDPQKHWGRPAVKGLNRVLQIMSIVSLAASVVLVFNTVTAIITQQTNQIGILKAIGGSQGKIAQVYLALILAYGVLALLIALPLGAWLSFFVTQYMLSLFNIDYNTFRFSGTTFLWQGVAALTVPLMAGLWPILSGTAITVREAIASYGLGGNSKNDFLDMFMGWFGQKLLSGPYALALANTFRQRQRLLLTQGVLTLAGVMFLVILSLSSSVNFTLDNIFSNHRYDFVAGFGQERVEALVALAQQHPGVKSVEVWASYEGTVLKENQDRREAGVGIELVGIPNGTDSFRPSRIVAGRWLSPEDDTGIVVNKDLADANDIQLGDLLTLDLSPLRDRKWIVIGLYKEVFNEEGVTSEIYANLDAVFQKTNQYNQGNQIRVLTQQRNQTFVSEVMTDLRQRYEQRKIKVYSLDSLTKIRQDAENQFIIVLQMLGFLAAVVTLVGGIGLMGAISISVIERTREIGVMRATGAQTRTIMGMFILEGVVQGLLSWLIAIPISFVLAKPLANMLGTVMFEANLDYQYNSGAISVWLIIILIISIIATILPARRATQVSVRESLAYD